GEVGLSILAPHFKNRLIDTLPNGDVERVPSAELDWTVAPRLEFGYRLPAAFGQISLAYRGFGADGSSTARDSVASSGVALRSRLDLNQLDVDYGSHELSLWPEAIMHWRLGVRLANLYYDARGSELVGGPAGVLEREVTNHYWGLGPHGGLELSQGFG